MSKKVCLIAILFRVLVIILSGCQTFSDIDADVTFEGETGASWLKCE